MISAEERIAATDAQRVVHQYFDTVVGLVSESDDGTPLYELFADDATWTFPGEYEFSGTKYGRTAIFEDFFKKINTLFQPELVIDDLLIMGDGPQVAAEYTVHKRSHNGKPFELRIIQVFEIASGKIAAVREYADLDYLRKMCIE